MITGKELRKKYIDFFKEKDHTYISGASLLPENDPTVLFTTAGMHPLVNFFQGEKHPSGKRLVNFQKCIRTVDIDEVGDNWHLTFFEMLGTWSLGDYFKKESIEMTYEFLTDKKWLGISSDNLAVTIFEGDKNVSLDMESKEYWLKVGIPESRIFPLSKNENWWGPAGQTGPCGPCTEIFFIFQDKPQCSNNCSPACSCGRYVEIWNNVFLEFNKDIENNITRLKQQNVDTGVGFERLVSVLNKAYSVYETEFFKDAINKIKNFTKSDITSESREIRIIADHIKASMFAISDGAVPSNLGAGYVTRRLIRRAIRFGQKIGINAAFVSEIAKIYIKQYKEVYPNLAENEQDILRTFNLEASKFAQALQHGIKEFNKVIDNMSKGTSKCISGRVAFRLYDTYGFPIEITADIASERGFTVDIEGYNKAFENHQEVSRAGSEKIFKGGLADNTKETTALHTATHLLHEALRRVLGEHVLQKGSNITAERLRFDFSHPQKVTKEELQEVENLINEQIKKSLDVTCEEMTVEEAIKNGAMGVFTNKYGEKVKVYSVRDFSKEICGGPHVKNTSEIGTFKIKKEEACSAGIRRIKGIIVKHSNSL